MTTATLVQGNGGSFFISKKLYFLLFTNNKAIISTTRFNNKINSAIVILSPPLNGSKPPTVATLSEKLYHLPVFLSIFYSAGVANYYYVLTASYILLILYCYLKLNLIIYPAKFTISFFPTKFRRKYNMLFTINTT